VFDLTPNLSSPLSFEEAVRLFQEWGFRVEPGPLPEEVTLIIDAPDHRNYSVYPAVMLPDIATAALDVRQRRQQACRLRQQARPRRLHRKVK
jgi:hypothetical protein